MSYQLWFNRAFFFPNPRMRAVRSMPNSGKRGVAHEGGSGQIVDNTYGAEEGLHDCGPSALLMPPFSILRSA